MTLKYNTFDRHKETGNWKAVGIPKLKSYPPSSAASICLIPAVNNAAARACDAIGGFSTWEPWVESKIMEIVPKRRNLKCVWGLPRALALLRATDISITTGLQSSLVPQLGCAGAGWG